jgi:hypothetical protein
MKPKVSQVPFLLKSVLPVLLLTGLAGGAFSQDLNLEGVDRYLSDQSAAQDGVTFPSYDGGAQTIETNLEAGPFDQVIDQAGQVKFASVSTHVSHQSSITASNASLTITGSLGIICSASATSTGEVDASPISTLTVSFDVDQPFAFLFKATTMSSDEGTTNAIPLVSPVAAVALGQIDGPILESFGEPNGAGSGPASGTDVGLLPPGRYTLSATVSDATEFNVSPINQIGNFNYSGQHSVSFTFQTQPPTNLPPLGPLTYSTGGTPATVTNQWQFSTVYAFDIPSMSLSVQSTPTPGDDTSWTDLPGNAQLTTSDYTNWTLQTQTVPAGNQYFRLVASSPFAYSNIYSAVVGPVDVLDVFPPLGAIVVLSWRDAANSEYPIGTWQFDTVAPALASPPAGAQMIVQWTETPDDPLSWSAMPGGGQMSAYYPNNVPGWELLTTNVPTGHVYFRFAVSAPGYIDGYSQAVAQDVVPPLPAETDNYTTSTNVPVADLPNVQSASDVALQASDCSTVTATVPAAQTASIAAQITASSADNCSQVVVSVGPGATLKVPRATMANGGRAEIKGILKGDGIVAQGGGNIVAQGGGNIVAQGGGNVTYDNKTANIVAQGGGNIVAQGGGNIVAQGGGNLLSEGGANLVPEGTGKVGGQGRASRPSRPHRPEGGPSGPQQPAFTGVMTIDGNYSQYGGTLYIAIAGTNTASQGAQQYDQLSVTGQAYLVGGTIAFGLFDPNSQTNPVAIFQPEPGASFDVIVASNIVLASNIAFTGPIWGTGQFFTGGVVTRPDGLQAVRLVATNVPPILHLYPANSELQLAYATNYTGYAIESTPTLAPAHWTTFSTGTNALTLSPTNLNQFFRLSKP